MAVEPQKPAGERLDSWKQIAGYLERDIRTVQRWEKKEALPVRRHVHDRQGTVYAYPQEIEAWRKSRGALPATFSSRLRRLWWLASAVLLIPAALGAAWLYKRSPWTDRPGPPPRGMVIRRIGPAPDPGRHESVSTDGRYIAYVDAGVGNVMLRELATGQVRRLTDKQPLAGPGEGFSPVVSPDGRFVAYTWNRDYSFDLRLIGSDGSGERVLYRNEAGTLVQPYGWFPDSRRILTLFRDASGANSLGWVEAATGSVRVLRDFDWRVPLTACASSDGQFVVYDLPSGTSPERDLFLMTLPNLSGQPVPAQPVERALVAHPGDDWLLGCLPGAPVVLFACDRAGSVDVWSVSLTGGQPRGEPALIRKNIGHVWPLGFTTGKSFYYSLRTGGMDIYLAALDPDTGKISAPARRAGERLVGYKRFPAWSPDGRRLAYLPHLMPWSPPAAVVASPETSEERRFNLPLHDVFGFCWGPDAESLIVTGWSHRLRAQMLRVAMRTGESVLVFEAGDPKTHLFEPFSSPDGNTVYYKVVDGAGDPGRLLARDLRTGSVRQLLASVYRYGLSPDGRTLAFSSFDDTAEYLRVVAVAGGPYRELFRQKRGGGRIRSVVWTPNGRYLLFSKKGELWRLPVAGGLPEKAGLSAEDLRELRVHPDGRQIAFAAGTARGELWVMESFLASP